jgi:transketolase
MLTPLKEFATDIRIQEMEEFKARGFGHIGGSLSITDCLAALYGGIMRIDPKNPKWDDRDRLVMSKGHAGPALYATLALKGYFPLEVLKTLNQNGTTLPSHCDRNLTTGVDMTTGSLGQGASTACGMALGLKLSGKDARVYLILGDGECQEGQVWEMALFAAQHKLGNFIAFLDYNKRQLDGYVADICDLNDPVAKFNSFNWYTQMVKGDDPDKIRAAVLDAQKNQGDRPAMIILDTIKGSGVKQIEEITLNHHINITPELADEIINQLKKEKEG